jgi:hypothetical protein
VDQNSLVIVGREVLKGLQAENFGLDAALWVRETMDDQWLLWIAPKTFKGRHEFFTVMSRVLSKLRARQILFEISNVRALEPNSAVLSDLKRRYGRVRPDLPLPLQSENLGGFYIMEGVLLYHDI